MNNKRTADITTTTHSSQRNKIAVSQASIRRARLGRNILWFLFGLYVLVFIIYLYAPLVVTGILAFNDNDIPSFPWKGPTLDWFYNPVYGQVEDETEAAGQLGIGRAGGRAGVFNDPDLLDSIRNSFFVAVAVTALSLTVGTTTSLLFERNRFKGDTLLYFAMLAPLVIPGVILGVSILAFGNSIVGPLRAIFGRETVQPIVSLLRPGLFIVVLGQFAWIATMATLIISARLRRFPMVQEDAAMDLGANRFKAITSVTIPFLRPALISAGVVAFLLSFENFGTTLFLIGSDPTLPILFFSRLRFEITPQINAVSVVLIMGTILLGMAALGLEQLRGGGRG